VRGDDHVVRRNNRALGNPAGRALGLRLREERRRQKQRGGEGREEAAEDHRIILAGRGSRVYRRADTGDGDESTRMLFAMVVSTVLVLGTILVHYEVLRLTSQHLRDLNVPPRFNILVVVVAAFVAHTIEVWMYGVSYWLLLDRLGLGGFGGPEIVDGFDDCLYFSAVTYTSLGIGDLYPKGHFRLVAGIEALNGLVLIGWSASFTYLDMERYWPLQVERRARRRRGRRLP